MTSKALWTLAVVLMTLVPALGATYQLADFLGNATFDMGFKTNAFDPTGETQYEAIPAAGDDRSWKGTGAGAAYYIDDTQNPADTPEIFAWLECNTGLDSSHVQQVVNLALNPGDTYELTVRYRTAMARGVRQHDPCDLYIEAIINTDPKQYVTFSIVTASSFSDSWQTATVSYTWTGDAVAAGGWDFSLTAVYLPHDDFRVIEVDTIGRVPEPSSLALLSVAGAGALFRRKR